MPKYHKTANKKNKLFCKKVLDNGLVMGYYKGIDD